MRESFIHGASHLQFQASKASNIIMITADSLARLLLIDCIPLPGHELRVWESSKLLRLTLYGCLPPNRWSDEATPNMQP